MSKLILDSLDEKNKHGIHESTAACLPSIDSKNKVDPLLLVIISVMQAINIGEQRTTIESKQLINDADNQMSLANQENELHMIPITKGMLYHTILIKHKHYRKEPVAHGWKRVEVDTFQAVQTKNPNALPALDSKNAKNQTLRDSITNEILLIRQNAQVHQSQLNSTVNQSQAYLQEGAKVMDILVNVTNAVYGTN